MTQPSDAPSESGGRTEITPDEETPASIPTTRRSCEATEPPRARSHWEEQLKVEQSTKPTEKVLDGWTAIPLPGDEGSKKRSRYSLAWDLLDLELKASTSLNTRATTIATLSGATIALLLNFAASVLRRDIAVPEVAIFNFLLTLAIALLAVTTLLGLVAAYPKSRWRHELRTLIWGISKAAPSVNLASIVLAMADKQRLTNEAKARVMRWCYGVLGGALLVVVFLAAYVALWGSGS